MSDEAHDQLLPPEPLCDELNLAVERAAARSEVSMNALHAAVRRFTAALKDEGASPEAILVSIKSVINSRTFPVLHSAEKEWTVDKLRQQISTWSIQEYFSDTRV